MIRITMIPEGIYSVSYKTHWDHPHVGRNGFQHVTLSVSRDMHEPELEKEIAEAITKQDKTNAVCRMVKITGLSKLDL